MQNNNTPEEIIEKLAEKHYDHYRRSDNANIYRIDGFKYACRLLIPLIDRWVPKDKWEYAKREVFLAFWELGIDRAYIDDDGSYKFVDLANDVYDAGKEILFCQPLPASPGDTINLQKLLE